MARVRMVTRTVTETVATMMCLDVNAAEVKTQVVSIAGEFKSAQDVLKAAQKVYETPTYKVAACTEYHTTEKLYGMPEADFIRAAKLLPPRSTKESADEE